MGQRIAAHKFWIACNAALAVLLAVAALGVLRMGVQSVGVAQAAYGANVDSGALAPLIALLYVLPGSGLFAAAAWARHRQWHDRRAVQWLAATWLAIPVLVLVGGSLLR